ncbi:Cilia- and flagella-associated protein 20 [Glycine max]|nr:Cilia- and flagella-associated protein 20 [Glycine max]
MIRMSDDDFELQIFKCAVTRVKPYICTMPLRMDEGWNQIQFNLVDFTKRAYGTNYVETLRVQVHANCRLRRIYFSDRLYSEEELPPEFKLYLPMQSRLVLLCFLDKVSPCAFHHAEIMKMLWEEGIGSTRVGCFYLYMYYV